RKSIGADHTLNAGPDLEWRRLGIRGRRNGNWRRARNRSRGTRGRGCARRHDDDPIEPRSVDKRSLARRGYIARRRAEQQIERVLFGNIAELESHPSPADAFTVDD